MTDTRDALNDAIMEHLGPAALTGGKMSIIEAFELGYQAATLAAQDKRKPLTDDCVKDVYRHIPDFNQWVFSAAMLNFSRAIEAAHGIKQ